MRVTRSDSSLGSVLHVFSIFLVPVKQVRHQATCLADIIASSLVPGDRGNEVELHLQSDLLLSGPFSIKRVRSPFRLNN